MTSSIAPLIAGRPKAWITLQARAALAGIVANLIDTDDGRIALIVSNGPYTKCLESIEQAEAWLALVSGGKLG